MTYQQFKDLLKNNNLEEIQNELYFDCLNYFYTYSEQLNKQNLILIIKFLDKYKLETVFTEIILNAQASTGLLTDTYKKLRLKYNDLLFRNQQLCLLISKFINTHSMSELSILNEIDIDNEDINCIKEYFLTNYKKEKNE